MRRKTSSLERYMLFFGRQFPLNFGFRFKLNTRLDAERTVAALRSLAPRHPVLFAHQEYTEGKQMDMVYPDETTLLVSEYEGSEDPDAVLLSCMIREFNPFVGPLFSLDYRFGPGATELFFSFQHGAVDGIAAVYFMHDFLSLYQGMEVDIPATISMPVLYDVLEDAICAELLTRPEPDWKKSDPPPPEPFDMPPYTVPDFYLRTFELDKFATDRLVQDAKAVDQTVHSFLGARILKASADILGPTEGFVRTIQCPVDFRQYLKEEFRTVAGVYNGIVKVPVDCRLPIGQIASTIKAGIAANRAGYKDIEEYFHFRDSFDNVPDPESLMMGFPPDIIDYDFSFSNLGKTVIRADYAGLKIDSFYGPIFTAVHGETVIGLNTTNGELRMSLIFDRAIPKAQSYQTLGDRIAGIFSDYR